MTITAHVHACGESDWTSLVRKLPRVANFYKTPRGVVRRRWHLNIKPYVEDLKWTEAENVRPASVEARARTVARA